MSFLNFLDELMRNEEIDGKIDIKDYGNKEYDILYRISQGFFSDNFIFLTTLGLVFNTTEGDILTPYEDTKNTYLIKKNNGGFKIFINKKIYTIDNNSYAEQVQKIIEISKKYDALEPKKELDQILNILNVDLSTYNPSEVKDNLVSFFYIFGSKILDLTANKDQSTIETLKEYALYYANTPSEKSQETIGTMMYNLNSGATLLRYNNQICQEDLFYDNIDLITALTTNNTIDENIKIYYIIHSNTGDSDTGISDIAKKGVDKIFNDGLFGALKGFAKNIGRKIINKKVALILTNKNVIVYDIEEQKHREFTFKQAINFVYKKDEYFDNAVDVYENGLTNELIADNVPRLLYKQFYEKVTELSGDISSTPSNQIIDKKSKLIELKGLFEDGLIDEDEYKVQKQIILNS